MLFCPSDILEFCGMLNMLAKSGMMHSVFVIVTKEAFTLHTDTAVSTRTSVDAHGQTCVSIVIRPIEHNDDVHSTCISAPLCSAISVNGS